MNTDPMLKQLAKSLDEPKKEKKCAHCRQNFKISLTFALSILHKPLNDSLTIAPFHITVPGLLMVTIDHKTTIPWLVKKYKDKTLCKRCLTIIERKYILDIPQEDLPLYLNDTWITELGIQTYKMRLGYTEKESTWTSNISITGSDNS